MNYIRDSAPSCCHDDNRAAIITNESLTANCSSLTCLLVEVQVVVVSASQLSHYLPVVVVLCQPAVTGEPKCFV